MEGDLMPFWGAVGLVSGGCGGGGGGSEGTGGARVGGPGWFGAAAGGVVYGPGKRYRA